MANTSLGDTYSILHSDPTVATSGFPLMSWPANNLLSRTDASAMAQFSMELRELEAVNALSTLSQVSRPSWTPKNNAWIVRRFGSHVS